MTDKQQGQTSARVTPSPDKPTGKPPVTDAVDGDERVRQGVEDAANPEPQGDGDPSPLDETES